MSGEAARASPLIPSLRAWLLRRWPLASCHECYILRGRAQLNSPGEVSASAASSEVALEAVEDQVQAELEFANALVERPAEVLLDVLDQKGELVGS